MATQDDIVTQIIKGVTLALDEYTNTLANAVKGPILVKIREIVGQILRASPEYTRLRSNTSEYHQFGIPEIERLMDAVVNKILSKIGLNIEFRKRTGQGGYYTGTFVIKLLDLTYQDILSMPEATFTYEKEVGMLNYGRRDSDILPWLEWLLLEGDTPVILNYQYAGIYTPASRTGYGIMINSGLWRVPSNIAGTREDNWLTRAISKLDGELQPIIEQELKNYV